MRRATRCEGPAPEDISTARRKAIIRALVEQALADQDYLEAVIVATGNIIGIRSVQAGVPVEDVLDLLHSIAADTARANRAEVLQ
jgi:hypothetical protein